MFPSFSNINFHHFYFFLLFSSMKARFFKQQYVIILCVFIFSRTFNQQIFFYVFFISVTRCSWGRRNNFVMTSSLCTSQWRCRYDSNETPNDVSVERRQDASVARLPDVVLERRDDVSRGCNKDVPSVRLQNVSKKSQMKHSTRSQCYLTKTFQWYVFTTSH